MELFGKQILTVGEITTRIKDLLEGEFAHVYVEGEISGLKAEPSGHVYLTLKDADAQLSAVMWRSTARLVRFKPENGLTVVCRGRISVYPPRGNYQLILDTMQPKGIGELALAFEQLKKRLASEGLFDADRKKPLPPYPSRIGIVTSPAGAAVRDMLRVIFDRWDNADVLVLPARVQGTGAAAEIAAMIETANRHALCDVLIVGRGGGSIEDLWAFNEEPIARAIALSAIPIISAVGHEIDTTIADLVADVRAPTPSIAGELVVPRKSDKRREVADLRDELTLQIQTIVQRRRREIEYLTRRLRDPRRLIDHRNLRVDELTQRMQKALRHRSALARQRVAGATRSLNKASPAARVRAERSRLEALLRRIGERVAGTARDRRRDVGALSGRLNALSPLAVLNRGYAIVRNVKRDAIVRSPADAEDGDPLAIRVAGGELNARAGGRKE